MHICIPTKGRPGTTVYQRLGGIPFTHFVEPQDLADYSCAGVPNLKVLPANNQGIAYARNFILGYARQSGHEWIWMIDDDVSSFGVASAGKAQTLPAHVVLSDFCDIAKRYYFPVNGINYRQYAWACSKSRTRYRINTKTAEVCTLLFVPKISWKYRSDLDMKEDRDFCMSAIKHSSGIFFDSFSFFNAPNVGTNAGGLQSHYQAQRDHQAAVRFVKEWAPYASACKKAGRIDAKLDLKGLALSLNRQIR